MDADVIHLHTIKYYASTLDNGYNIIMKVFYNNLRELSTECFHKYVSSLIRMHCSYSAP